MPKTYAAVPTAKHESVGALMEPSVAFLKPIGIDMPERELAVHLAFRIASADRTPADRVGNVLRAGWFQEFRGGGQTCVQYAKQRTTGQKQAFFDIAAAVDVGIVDQAFPTDRRTRFSKYTRITISNSPPSSSFNAAKRRA